MILHLPHPALPVLLGAILLSACTTPPPDEEYLTPVSKDNVQTITLERSYTLTDPKEAEFLEQVRGAAKDICGASHVILSTRPIGSETVAEDSLYRLYEVQIACKG